MLLLLLSTAALLRAPLCADAPLVLRSPGISAVESWYDKSVAEKAEKQARRDCS